MGRTSKSWSDGAQAFAHEESKERLMLFAACCLLHLYLNYYSKKDSNESSPLISNASLHMATESERVAPVKEADVTNSSENQH